MRSIASLSQFEVSVILIHHLTCFSALRPSYLNQVSSNEKKCTCFCVRLVLQCAAKA